MPVESVDAFVRAAFQPNRVQSCALALPAGGVVDVSCAAPSLDGVRSEHAAPDTADANAHAASVCFKQEPFTPPPPFRFAARRPGLRSEVLLLLAHERVPIVERRRESLLDRPRADPAH